MKFQICIGGVELSAETLRFGARIAKAFEAHLSLLYVQERLPHAVRPEVGLTREKLSEWEIELPGVKVLVGARSLLLEEGLLKTGPSGEIVERHGLKPAIRGAYELHVYGLHGQDIRLRLREGDVIDEVNKEVESDQHDLVIFGASQKRTLLNKLIQFIDCSMLVVKNPRNVKYEFLICTDSSPASHRAELFGAKLARSLDAPVTLLSVAKFKNREHVAMEGAERASRFLARAGVHHSISVRVGNVVDQIAAHARENTVVVMGTSRMSELRKLLFGSKPMKVVEAVNCPVLIVK
jgi:nucleotide-binding universal stress UspA family protein